jgi:hypothetical protein
MGELGTPDIVLKLFAIILALYGHAMRPEITRIITKIHDAGSTPEAWPDALKALTEATGTAGAACIVLNKRTGRADWVCFSGLSAEFQSQYMNYYALLDPYSPLLHGAGRWTKLSECLTESFLRKSEWYNDFVLACGIRDALGTRLVNTPSRSVLFGLQQQIGRQFADKTGAVLESVAGPLSSAAFQHVEHLFGPAYQARGAESATVGTRYFFHVCNGRKYPDATGKLFPTLGEALAYGSVFATELGQEKGWDEFEISVTDEEGRAIARIPVRS